MKPLADLQTLLLALYQKDTTYYTNYTGSWIADAVYQLDYPTLGKLLSQMLPITEGTAFSMTGELDGHNAFEEFVCDLLFQLFQQREIITANDGTMPAKIDLMKLQATLSECEIV